MRPIKNSLGVVFSSLYQLVGFTLFFVLLLGCGKDKGINPADNKVTILSLTPASPASLAFDDSVIIIYDYEVVDPNGVRIWVQPYTNGSISPKYAYTSSPLFQGNGRKTVSISITSGDMPVVVDQLKIKIVNADNTEDISERFESVNYTFQ